MAKLNGSGPKRQQPGINRITLAGYKSIIREQTIDIHPLTILAGANSSGKSAIMQPLLLMKQTLEATWDPGPLLLNGPHVRITSFEHLLSRGNVAADAFTVGIGTDQDEFVSSTFKRRSKKGFDLAETHYQTRFIQGTLRENMPHDDIVALGGRFDDFRRSLADVSRGTPQWGISRERCFLTLVLSFASKEGERPGPLFSGMLHNQVEGCIRGIIHLPGLRGNPERTYKTSAVGSEFPGVFQDYFASVINQWQANHEEGHLLDLNSALEKLGMTWKVEAQQLDDTQVELRVGRLRHSNRGGARDLVNMADVGFGVSQSLPVIIALLTARPGQLVYLEQPEIHLHPRAQYHLAWILADASKRGVRVVVETHSDLLLLGIQSLVAEGYVDRKSAKLHWFHREDDGATTITSADLDDTGAYGAWPEDFSEVALRAQSRYLDAAEIARARAR